MTGYAFLLPGFNDYALAIKRQHHSRHWYRALFISAGALWLPAAAYSGRREGYTQQFER